MQIICDNGSDFQSDWDGDVFPGNEPIGQLTLMQKAISLTAGTAKLVYGPKPSEPAKWVMMENQSGSTVLYWRQKNVTDDTLQDADAHSLLTGDRIVFDGQNQAKLPITVKCASSVNIILSCA